MERVSFACFTFLILKLPYNRHKFCNYHLSIQSLSVPPLERRWDATKVQTKNLLHITISLRLVSQNFSHLSKLLNHFVMTSKAYFKKTNIIEQTSHVGQSINSWCRLLQGMLIIRCDSRLLAIIILIQSPSTTYYKQQDHLMVSSKSR